MPWRRYALAKLGLPQTAKSQRLSAASRLATERTGVNRVRAGAPQPSRHPNLQRCGAVCNGAAHGLKEFLWSCRRSESALTYTRPPTATHSGLMRKPKQTTLEISLPTAPGALRRGSRSRRRVQSLRRPMLLDFDSWIQLTQGAADAIEAAGKQGRLNFG